jgi:[glutamine synthetase] adenylyltransferase / [glutamine synthetase]-adenylyl-L-tyrosine phosphorylase
MVTLPELKDWSALQLDTARGLSPALARYLTLLETHSAETFPDRLRLRRHEDWCRATLATLFATNSAQEVCSFWSQCTLKTLELAWRQHKLEEENICLITMGKLGALELNLSSDIDIFFVSENEPDKNLIKKIRSFISDIADLRSTGFCYRVDLDLRPGGSSAPLIINFDQMTNHYGYQGETWERVAMIRQKIPLGSPALAAKILTFCQKFSFRRHIDYSLFQDLYSMREKIQNNQISQAVTNIKFRKGGIRDLELLVHSLQLIHGGKNKKLLTSSVAQALEELRLAEHISNEDANTLTSSYWFFREIENKIQCENDQHTYDLGPSQLVPREQKQLFEKKADQIALIVDQFLRPYQKQSPTDLLSLEAANEEFKKMAGVTPQIEAAWTQLLQTKIQSRAKERDERERQLFLKNVLLALKTCQVDPTLALQHLHQFIVAIKAKTSFFVLLNQHQALLEELIWIFSCSPFLSQILIHRPELVDSFLLKTAEIDLRDEDQFFSSAQDFKLLSDLISSSKFLRNRNVQELTQNLSRTTDTIVLNLLKFLKEKFKSEIHVLCLGKWASRQMGLTSDLDFVFLADETPTEPHLKMARRFIHFLNSPHSGQKIYNIDLRLRPSGNAGPLILTRQELTNYLNLRAEVWERQAYLCQRLLTEETTQPLFNSRELTSEELKKLIDIQTQLLTENRVSYDLKKNYGGLLHTELTLQTVALVQKKFPSTPDIQGLCQIVRDIWGPEIADEIEINYQALRTYQQLLILVSHSSESRIDTASADIQKLCSLLGNHPKVLLQEVSDRLSKQRSLLNKLDPLGQGLKIES